MNTIQSMALRSGFLCLLLNVVGCSHSAPAAKSEQQASADVESQPNDAQATDSPSASNQSIDKANQATSNLLALGVKLSSTSPQATFYDSVDWGDHTVEDRQIDWMLQLSGIKRLTIRQSALTDLGWQKLSKLSAIEHLDLRDTDIDNRQLQSLVGGMNNIRSLKLGGVSGRCRVSDAGLEALCRLPNIKSISLDGLAITVAGLTHLAQCKQLAELNLAKTGIGDDALESVGQLESLRKLRLASNAITADGLRHLSAKSLEELDLSECPGVNDQAMLEIGRLSKLKKLNLWSCPVTDQGLEQLAQMPELQWLNLDKTAVTDAGLDWLQGLGQLQFLHLGSTAVTNEGMPKLAMLRELKKLIVTRTAVTQHAVDVLQQALPDISIQLQYVAGQ